MLDVNRVPCVDCKFETYEKEYNKSCQTLYIIHKCDERGLIWIGTKKLLIRRNCPKKVKIPYDEKLKLLRK